MGQKYIRDTIESNFHHQRSFSHHYEEMILSVAALISNNIIDLTSLRERNQLKSCRLHFIFIDVNFYTIVFTIPSLDIRQL